MRDGTKLLAGPRLGLGNQQGDMRVGALILSALAFTVVLALGMATNAWVCAVALAVLLASAMPARAQPASGDTLARIGHIVVIFEENRSFDNFFGKFPGANGIANAGDKAIQIGPDGKPYKTLPRPINSNLKPPDIDKRFPAQLPNRPFQINRYVSLDDDTGDLIHALLSGADADKRRGDEPLCRGVECQGPGDGLFRYLEDLSVEAREANTRWATPCSIRRSVVRS